MKPKKVKKTRPTKPTKTVETIKLTELARASGGNAEPLFGCNHGAGFLNNLGLNESALHGSNDGRYAVQGLSGRYYPVISGPKGPSIDASDGNMGYATAAEAQKFGNVFKRK